MTQALFSTRKLLAGASLALLPALALPALAQAQSQTQPPAATTPAKDEIVVVANRAPDPLSKVAASVSVINAQTLKTSQASNLADLLAQTPGVNIARNGGEGQPTSVFIRGADSDQTLVLIDGVQMVDPGAASGGYDFSDMLTGDLSRVEVLRGAQSTLWGSQAIGGVVNIITAEPGQNPGGQLDVEGGSRDTQYYRGGVGGTWDRLSLRLAGGYYTTAGIPDFDRELGGTRPDGYHDAGFSGRLGWAFTPDVQLDLRGYVTSSHTHFDGYDTASGNFGDDNEYDNLQQYVGYAGLNFGLFDGRLKNRLAVQYTAIDRRNYDPGPYLAGAYYPGLASFGDETFYSNGQTERLDYQGTLQISDGYRAVFGAQHDHASVTLDTPAYDYPTLAPVQAHSDLDSGYAQIEGEVVKGLNLTAGGRYDSFTSFGGHLTGQVGGVWSLNGGETLLRASFAQGFKAPALYQLYSPYGTANLRPEQANSWEAGVQQYFWARKASLTATYFGRDTANLIEFVSCYGVTAGLCATNTSGGYYANVDKAAAEGLELQAELRPVTALTLTANYTYVDSEDLTAGKLLPRRPKDLANAQASYTWPIRLTTAAAVRYSASSFDDPANQIPLKSYALVDLRASYPISDRIEAYGRIENLLDRHYETTYQYGSLGRGAFVGLRARF